MVLKFQALFVDPSEVLAANIQIYSSLPDAFILINVRPCSLSDR